MTAPDVKQLVIAHLPAQVGVPVVAKRPDDGTATFVRVVHTGGPGRHDRILQTVQLTLASYARSDAAAQRLASDVDDWMHSLPESVHPVAAIPWSTTPQDSPDPDTNQARYTATYQLIVKAQ